MKSACLITSLIPLAAATRNFAELAYGDALKQANAAVDCEFPAYYSISAFKTFTPTSSNETEVSFGYVDSDTNITTTCNLNSTSTNIAAEGHSPEYACGNSQVDFYWESNKLTVVELTCSSSS